MRSIERNFEEEQRRDPNASDYLSLYRAVKGKGWSESMIRRWFRKLVDTTLKTLNRLKEYLGRFWEYSNASLGFQNAFTVFP